VSQEKPGNRYFEPNPDKKAQGKNRKPKKVKRSEGRGELVADMGVERGVTSARTVKGRGWEKKSTRA